MKAKYLLPAAALGAWILVLTSASYGKPEYTKATKKACTYCHVDAKAKPKELKAPGQYYKEHKSLEGYKE